MTASTTLPGLHRLDATARGALFSGARTAHTFTDTPVDDAELRSIWELAKWPPSAANMQPLRVLYVTSPEGRARLVEQMNTGNRAKTAAAPAVAVLAADSRFHDHLATVVPFKPELGPFFEGNEVARTQASTFNAALQAGYFIMSVRAHGLAAGPMGGFDKAGVDAEFFAASPWRSFLVVNIGHPAPDAYRDRQPRLDSAITVAWA